VSTHATLPKPSRSSQISSPPEQGEPCVCDFATEEKLVNFSHTD
jgi:hypothetical protein